MNLVRILWNLLVVAIIIAVAWGIYETAEILAGVLS